MLCYLLFPLSDPRFAVTVLGSTSLRGVVNLRVFICTVHNASKSCRAQYCHIYNIRIQDTNSTASPQNCNSEVIAGGHTSDNENTFINSKEKQNNTTSDQDG